MISSGNIPHGPYRATKLWNEVVRLFQAGIPTKKHRQLLKSYEDCFSATEAIDWLHALLKANRNFGTQVTRQQTIQLLQKFLKNHVFEDVHGMWGTEDFSDNNQLYRFPIAESPSKSIRQPLALLPTNTRREDEKKSNVKNSSQLFKSTPNLSKISPPFVCGQNNGIMQDKTNSLQQLGSKEQQQPELTQQEMAGVWKSSLLVCLKKVLHLENTTEIFPGKELNADWIQHNATQMAPSGVVHVKPEEELPCWLLSAMKCLAGWPNSTDSGLPNYQGFEKDVFKAIWEYFRAMPDALTTHGYFEIFTTLLVRGELLDEMCRGHNHTVAIEDSQPHVQSEAELDKIHKKLVQAQMRHKNLEVRRQKSGRRGKKLFNADENNVGMKLCPRHAGLEANNNHTHMLQRNLSLNDNSMRKRMSGMMEDHFQSTPALDVLDEETSFHYSQENNPIIRSSHTDLALNKHHNIAASLPELRVSEHSVSNHDDNSEKENYVNLSFQHKAFPSSTSTASPHSQFIGDGLQEDQGDDIFSSVEDLLFNMSHTMRNELELDLMAENDEDQPQDDKDLFSPPYRTMKPLPKNSGYLNSHSTPFKDTNTDPKFRSAAPKKMVPPPDLIPTSGDPYMEMLPQKSRLQEEKKNKSSPPSAFDMYNNMHQEKRAERYGSLPRLANKPSPPAALVGRVYSVRNAENIHKRKHCEEGHRLNRSRPKSDIIERREVPPYDTDSSTVNAHRIKSRIMRLPYVSVGIRDRQLKAPSMDDVAGKFARLSRSYSSLHPRRTQPPQPMASTSNLQPPNTSLLRHKSVSRPNITIPSEPQSPLSAALDLARKQRVAIGEQQNVRPHTAEAFQLCLLLLSPVRRRKLHLLLRLLSKMLSNPNLISFDNQQSLRSLLIQKFTACVIRQRDVSDDVESKLSERVFCFMLDHASLVMTVPEKLRTEVESAVKRIVADKESMKRDALGRKKLSRQYTFCKQVSSTEYEDHRQTALRSALTELLQKTVDDQTISAKEKKKKLKQFQKSYPEIFKARFPNGHPKLETTSNKKQPLLSGAIQRLRNFRL
uniref:DEP domain-containing protein 1A n=1 Tax=Phallusia mammillata TaxID=59560 RepID=A0A6F9DAZ8_9ASCI|nr:DEP domain-containing protein 1A [Phallusia mammillata]